MILETFLYTALPTARKGNELLASVLITPQLGGEEGNPKRLPLSRYRDLRDGEWPRIVNAITWQFVLRWSADDSQEDYLDAERISPDADPALFATMFPGDMPVDPFTFRNPASAEIVSYPAARLAGDLDRLQETVARQAPEQRPMLDALVSRGTSQQADYTKLPLDGFVLDESRQRKYALEIDQVLSTSGVLTTPAAGAEGTARSLAMLQAMLRPSAAASTPRKPLWPDLDFHQVVSLLQSHPNLLRRLGFLVDLRIPITRIRRNTGTPRVFPGIDWPPPYDPDAAGVDITSSFPRVRTTLGEAYFRPAPRKADLTDTGYVNLSSAVAITSTIESEAIGTSVDATGTARIMAKKLEGYGTPDRRAIPARHSSGVEIVRPDEAKRWQERMSVTDGFRRLLATGDDLLFDAEDVLMGYRVDVRQVGERTWHSLHRRHGVLTPYVGNRAQSPIDLGDDEGWSETAASANPEDEVDGVLTRIRIRETLAQWNGWSLSLPTPGESLDAEDRPSPAPTADDGPDLIASMHGTIDYSAPARGARLPALRFSATEYEARLRWVDLGGNSAAPEADGGSILKFPYMRHDPVNSPDLYLTAEPEWSESVDVMVLRTGNQASSNRKTTRRWVAPPRSAAFFCLLHGVFDDANGRPQAGMYATIAGRESETIPTRSTGIDNVVYAPSDPGAVPYLPDPLASGLLVRGAPKPGATYDRELSATYRGTWPAVEVASIEARAGVRNATSVSGDSIVVDLEPGRVAHLRVSHALTNEGLRLMDLWRRISRFADGAKARKGAYWQLTPDRTLVVVHAVQRPVKAPAFLKNPVASRWRAARDAGQTAAELTGSLTVDAPSTESVDIIGARTYAVDQGPGTERPRVVVDADMGVVGTVSIPDPAPGGGERRVDDLKVRAAFSDTTRQQLTLTAEAKSRFAEYFRKTISAGASEKRIRLNGGQPVVSGSTRVTYTTFDSDFRPTTRVAPETAYAVDPQAGVLTISAEAPVADRIPSNAVLSISFIPGPITKSSTESSVAPASRRASLTVPSSARPLAPVAEWILPAFTWSGPSGGQRTSTRSGGWLRIYLARPWFTSGVGEELAIVLQPANSPGGSNAARDAFVTQWALDPITTGGRLPSGSVQYPKAQHFDSRSIARNVRLAEMDADVDLVRYPIGTHNAQGEVSGYDADRDMYFVDIKLDPDAAYRPFVRLALARYQPVSVDGYALSPIALVDVVQLEPDRTASVAVSGSGNSARATVTLRGRSYKGNEVGSGPGKAVAILERYDGPTGPKAEPSQSAAWTQLDTVVLKGRVDGSGDATWNGSITVPGNRPAGRYRIVLEQFELIRTDGSAAAYGSLSAEQKQKVTGGRLVHQDIIGI